MKTSHNLAAIVAALSCSILLCFTVAPCVGFQQQPLRPVPCGFAGCGSQSMYSSSLASTRGRLSRQQKNDKLVWWGKQQKPTSSLMADVAASAGDEKKGFFDKVCLRLDSSIGSSIIMEAKTGFWRRETIVILPIFYFTCAKNSILIWFQWIFCTSFYLIPPCPKTTTAF